MEGGAGMGDAEPLATDLAHRNHFLIRLASGGTVALVSDDLNLFSLSETDREFILALVDQMRAYAERSAR